MTVLILEDNLLWSARLKRTIEGLGHRALVASPLAAEIPQADAAIVNLSAAAPNLDVVVTALRERGIHVIGHAGHKEREVHESPAAALCDQVLTNSQATYKLEAALALVDIRV
ncbi:MAG TPA: hypothetical protein PLL78_03375 [Fimbriimonadaceae bacterium]|nr:hypothetical protein [Fimbriimonadaceae bacterium]HRJ95701.1 hypothetical protein [Fimbriimonadaceae bacterium]